MAATAVEATGTAAEAATDAEATGTAAAVAAAAIMDAGAKAAAITGTGAAAAVASASFLAAAADAAAEDIGVGSTACGHGALTTTATSSLGPFACALHPAPWCVPSLAYSLSAPP